MEPEKTPENKKKALSIVVGILAFGLAYFATQYFFSKKPSFNEAMVEVANEINKTCPMMIDQDTQLDNTMALPNNTFVYNYTLVNLEKENIDIEAVKNFIEPKVVNNMKTSPDMKLYRENRTTMTYNYKDKNGIFVLKINVGPEKYE